LPRASHQAYSLGCTSLIFAAKIVPLGGAQGIVEGWSGNGPGAGGAAGADAGLLVHGVGTVLQRFLRLSRPSRWGGHMLQLHCRYCRRPWLSTVARAGVRLSRDFSALLSMGDENMQTCCIGRRDESDENLSTAAEAATTTATEGTVMQTVNESVQDATNRGENHPTVD
jgi:hypothetical protein